MAFRSKTPQKPMKRSKPLQSKAPMKSGGGLNARPPSPAEARKTQQKALQQATLRAFEKARAEAVERGVDLSEWEKEFLESVPERVKTYGRAFADPDKGALGGTLSMRQGQKLKEIRRKTRKSAAEE